MTVHVTEMTMTELAKRLFPDSDPPEDHEKISVLIIYHATPAAVKEASRFFFREKVRVLPSSATVRLEIDDEVDEVEPAE